MFEQKTIAETKRLLEAEQHQGLSDQEVRQRLGKYGPNELEERGKKSLLRRILDQFLDPLIYVLLAAGTISLLLGEYGDAVIIAAVVCLNGTVGLIQEGKARKALDALKKMTRLRAIVRRNGVNQEIDAAGLVPGDLVLLDAGRQVPADLRLIFTENMKVEESALTGESVPVTKDAGFLAAKQLPTGDCKNLAFMSANVTAGRGEGLVVATGMETEIGKIARLIHESPEEATPLQKRLGDLGSVLSILAVALCAVLFGVAVWQQRDVGEMLITAISLAVAAVPEGLPAVVTIVLALSVSRMVKVNTIVRRLPSVETLGAVSVVCSDKTGTLTKNKMTVEVWETAAEILGGRPTGNRAAAGKVAAAEKSAIVRKNDRDTAVDAMTAAFILCNDAEITGSQRLGDPTELALLDYAAAQGTRRTALEKKSPRVGERAFESERKLMTTVHKDGSGKISYTKGAPDVILSRCSHYLDRGTVKPMGEAQRRKITARIGELSAKALRVLGAARSDGDGREEKEMVFLGLAGMTDPPRAEAAHAVSMFRDAHVRTVMITGDHKKTALAIAKKLNIAESENQCMSGEEIDRADEETLKERVRNVTVFARVSSDHKVRIVRALKSLGNIVAMTGDGVNDAPSLKAADVGIAMGKSGTDVAKQAADIVLTDDNFATIERAIEEGRGIYENIKKSVIFLLSSNFGEIMTMFTAIVCFLPSPLKASHILWINLITDSLPALALGTDINDGASLMKEPPRKESESLFSRGGLSCTLFYGFLIATISLCAFLKLPLSILASAGREISLESLAAVLREGQVLIHSQTYAFTVLGLSQLFHSIGMRDTAKSVFRMNHLKNKLMLVAFFVGVMLQVAVTEVPYLVSIFQTVKLTAGEWRELLILAAAPLAAHELLIFLNKFQKGKEDQNQAAHP